MSRRMLAALVAASLTPRAVAWNFELPSCLDPFKPFVEVGCFDDSNSTFPALTFRSTESSDDMAVESCVAFCKGNGYRYAGLEYYGTCFCGQTINSAVLPADQCNFPCNGNSSETCGGNSKISVWADPTFGNFSDVTIADYKEAGCWSDDSSEGRSLSWRQDALSGDSMTTETCLGACKDGGYPYAGLEFGGECYCGVAVGNFSAEVDASACSIACNGNAEETCGGSNVLSLYIADELLSLEPCGDDGDTESMTSSLSSTTAVSSSASTSVVVSTTESVTSSSSSLVSSLSTVVSTTSLSSSSIVTPILTSLTIIPTTTLVPITTKTPTTSLSATTTTAFCTTIGTAPAKCEYGCGSWCANPLPDFTGSTTCKTSYASCQLQVASCFRSAGFPAAIQCFQYSLWCENIYNFCTSSCILGACSKSGCYSKLPPVNHIPGSTTTSVFPCSVTPSVPTVISITPTMSVKPSTTSKTSTSTSTVPSATSICTQPSNILWGYSPGNPCGGISLPVVSCNTASTDKSWKPYKLYNDKNWENCPSYGSGSLSSACVDACATQRDSCLNVYAEGCKQKSQGADTSAWYGTQKRDESYFQWKRAVSFSDNYQTAKSKCNAQYNDCVAANSYVSSSSCSR